MAFKHYEMAFKNYEMAFKDYATLTFSVDVGVPIGNLGATHVFSSASRTCIKAGTMQVLGSAYLQSVGTG